MFTRDRDFSVGRSLCTPFVQAQAQPERLRLRPEPVEGMRRYRVFSIPKCLTRANS